MSKKQERIITIAIATGGTAGHVFPAQAVGEILGNGNRIVYLCDKRGEKFINNTIPNIGRNDKVILPIRNFSGSWIKKFISLPYLFMSILYALVHLKRCKAKIVLGFGSFASFPTLLAAVILRLPIILHEQNAVLGRVNKMFLKYAKFIATSYSETLNLDTKYADRVIFTGNPIRQSVFEVKRRRTKITSEFQITIVGGSQGASIFDKIIASAISLLSPEIQKNLLIFQQVRKDHLSQVEEIYNNSQVKKHILREFFDDIPQMMIDSDLVISRGGASAISEISHIGVPSIIVPMMQAKDNHQYYNAQCLEKNGAGIVLTEDIFTEDKLAQEIQNIFANRKALEKMTIAAKTLGQNTAAQKLAIKINDCLIKL